MNSFKVGFGCHGSHFGAQTPSARAAQVVRPLGLDLPELDLGHGHDDGWLCFRGVSVSQKKTAERQRPSEIVRQMMS